MKSKIVKAVAGSAVVGAVVLAGCSAPDSHNATENTAEKPTFQSTWDDWDGEEFLNFSYDPPRKRNMECTLEDRRFRIKKDVSLPLTQGDTDAPVVWPAKWATNNNHLLGFRLVLGTQGLRTPTGSTLDVGIERENYSYCNYRGAHYLGSYVGATEPMYLPVTIDGESGMPKLGPIRIKAEGSISGFGEDDYARSACGGSDDVLVGCGIAALGRQLQKGWDSDRLGRVVGLSGAQLWTLPLQLQVENKSNYTVLISPTKPRTGNPDQAQSVVKQLEPVENPKSDSDLRDGGDLIEPLGDTKSLGFLRRFDTDPSEMQNSGGDAEDPVIETDDANLAVVKNKVWDLQARFRVYDTQRLESLYESAGVSNPKFMAKVDCYDGQPNGLKEADKKEFHELCGEFGLVVKPYSNSGRPADATEASAELENYDRVFFSAHESETGVKPTGPAADENFCLRDYIVEDRAHAMSLLPDGILTFKVTIDQNRESVPSTSCGGNKPLWN